MGNRYGPRQTPKTVYSEKGKLNCFFKLATFAETGERRKYVAVREHTLPNGARLMLICLQDKDEKELGILMVQALEVSLRLETFPKSEVDVFALVIEAGGGVLSAAITAASLALADAGIEMYDLVASCSVVRLHIAICCEWALISSHLISSLSALLSTGRHRFAHHARSVICGGEIRPIKRGGIHHAITE